MKFLRSALTFFAVVACTLPALADTPKPAKEAAPEMTEETRMNVIRELNAELVYARRLFPIGPKGLTIKDGKVTPDEEQVQSMIATFGPALKPGDRAKISEVKFKGNNAIVFEINGGPVKKKKWYEHIQISGMGGSATPTNPTDDSDKANFRGTLVTLLFDKHVPELSTDEIKELLRPVLDFNAKSAAQAYIDTLPPKVKDAIKNHQVLVGMNREMVTYAIGRPPKKYRDRDGDTAYEEWIYGEPPKDVTFVRFVGDEVVRREIMKVDGEKVVRNQREFEPLPGVTTAQGSAKEIKVNTGRPANAPTLKRPDEIDPNGEPLPKGGVDDPQGAPPPSRPPV